MKKTLITVLAVSSAMTLGACGSHDDSHAKEAAYCAHIKTFMTAANQAMNNPTAGSNVFVALGKQANAVADLAPSKSLKSGWNASATFYDGMGHPERKPPRFTAQQQRDADAAGRDAKTRCHIDTNSNTASASPSSR